MKNDLEQWLTKGIELMHVAEESRDIKSEVEFKEWLQVDSVTELCYKFEFLLKKYENA